MKAVMRIASIIASRIGTSACLACCRKLAVVIVMTLPFSSSIARCLYIAYVLLQDDYTYYYLL